MYPAKRARPFCEPAERLAFQRVDPPPAERVHGDKARPLERLEVFRHLGLSQLERERDLADGTWRGAEQPDDPQPIRLGQGGE